jgi:hypothetical protein
MTEVEHQSSNLKVLFFHNFKVIGLTQTERIYYALGRCGAGEARTTSTQCVNPKLVILG